MKVFKIVFLAVACAALASEAACAATIKGRVRLNGAPPAASKLNMAGDRACILGPDVFSEEVLVNAEGMLKNVFVHAKTGATATHSMPERAVVLDQSGCRYQPHVLGLRVDQPLEILNSDDTLHNVHAVTRVAKPFNIGMPIQGMRLQKTFDKSEVMIEVKCDVHPWMSAYIGVVDNPFYAVTDENGVFEIRGVPSGEYEFEAWHEKYGRQTKKLIVQETEESDRGMENPQSVPKALDTGHGPAAYILEFNFDA